MQAANGDRGFTVRFEHDWSHNSARGYGFAYKTVSPVMILILQIGPAHHAGSLTAPLYKQQSRKHRTALIFTAFFILHFVINSYTYVYFRGSHCNYDPDIIYNYIDCTVSGSSKAYT